MPKEANCTLCCVCRSVSRKQVDGEDFLPIFGSCQEYCVQLWAPQYKENIDRMEQDQLKDCSMWCMRKDWENGFIQRELRGDLNAVDNYQMGGYNHLMGKKQMGTLPKVHSAKMRDCTQVAMWDIVIIYIGKSFHHQCDQTVEKGPRVVMNSPSSETWKIQNPSGTALSSLL